jgi:glucose-1-phosphate thymidylyltransferase
MPLPEVVGLIPAAGRATRISPLPCSKELFPVGFQPAEEAQNRRPKVVSQYLLERLRTAGIRKVFVVLRAGKWDIPAYFGDGTRLQLDLAYLLMGLPHGTPFTLDQAYPFVQDKVLALGFPDIIIEPEDAFVPLLERLEVSEAEVVLGLFPADRPQKVDMVELDEEGRVQSFVIKPQQTDLQYTWLIAVWKPAFTRFLHEYLADTLAKESQEQGSGTGPAGRRELYVGDVMQAALERGMKVEGVPFPGGSYLDIGTPDDLARALQKYA